VQGKLDQVGKSTGNWGRATRHLPLDAGPHADRPPKAHGQPLRAGAPGGGKVGRSRLPGPRQVSMEMSLPLRGPRFRLRGSPDGSAPSSPHHKVKANEDADHTEGRPPTELLVQDKTTEENSEDRREKRKELDLCHAHPLEEPVVENEGKGRSHDGEVEKGAPRHPRPLKA